MHDSAMSILKKAVTFSLALSITAILVGCGPKAVRDSDVAGLDTEAMGTGLDRRDIEKLHSENMNAMEGSAIVKRWESEDSPQVAVLPFKNETSEHIDSALSALTSDIETTLVNAGHVTVISQENQQMLIEEIKKQSGGAFDEGKAAAAGRMLGIKYIITGKVQSTDEKMKGERRVQYYLYMQVLDVESGAIRFQNKATLTKALL